jgi:hypothetical protein
MLPKRECALPKTRSTHDQIKFKYRTNTARLRFLNAAGRIPHDGRPWGAWSDLQSTYNALMRGDINDDQATKQVKDNAEAAKAVAAQSQATQKPVGTNQYSEGVDNKNEDINTHPDGTSATYAERRLRKASETDLRIDAIYNRVLAGELSWNAAMIEAGFRKRRPSRKKKWVCPKCGCDAVRA